MPPTRSIKAPSYAAELYEFAKNTEQAAYSDLGRLFEDAGWRWRLRETGAQPMPDGSVLMSYDFMVGKSLDTLELFDSVTMHMNGSPGPVSLAARVALMPSLIYLVFGRLPPTSMPTETAAAEVSVDISDRDVVLPGDDGGEMLPLDDDTPGLELVERREPDGLPIFVDVYAMGADSGTVIDTLLSEVAAFLRTASAPEQVTALWTKNADAMMFVKDLGDDADRARMKGLFDEHKARVERAPVARTAAAPRRRVA